MQVLTIIGQLTFIYTCNMAKDPAFLFYSQDFLVGTMTMSFEDKGKYITILSYMHQKGRMDHKSICLLVGSLSDELLSKFQIDEDQKYYNTRLEDESYKRSKFIESRIENGKKGGRKKTNDDKAYAKANAKATNKLPENENEVILFFKENGYSKQSAINAYKYYCESNWEDSRGNKVKNWKQKMRGVWFKDDNKDKTVQKPIMF